MTDIKQRTAINTPAKSFLLVCIGLILVVSIVYWKTNSYKFINFDDNLYVYENAYVQKGLTAESIRWAFDLLEKSHRTYWHPLTWLSHMLDCELYGLNPDGHHVTNVFLHTLNVLLLFWAFLALTGSFRSSAIIALIFAVHPIAVDTVAWISERKNLVSTSFWFMTMWVYAKYARNQSWSLYCLLCVTMLFGLLAKPMLITLPCTLLLLDYWPLGRVVPFEGKPNGANSAGYAGRYKPFSNTLMIIRKNKRIIVEKLPLFSLSFIWVYLSTRSVQKIGCDLTPVNHPLSLRIANAVVSYIKYLVHLFWPYNLTIFYPYPETMLPLWQIICSLLILLIITVFVLRVRKKRPWWIIGWFWFLGTFVPVAGLVQGGLWPALADRWAYVPFIGIYMIIAWEMTAFLKKNKTISRIMVVNCCIIAGLLIIISALQVRYWKDSITLFRHAVAVTDNNFIAYNNLGAACESEGAYEEAMGYYNHVLRINPQYIGGHINMGTVLAKTGDIVDAKKHFEVAVQLAPDKAVAHYNLGRVLRILGNTDAAIKQFKLTAQLRPDLVSVYIEWTDALVRQGRFDKAIRLLETVANNTPGNRKIEWKLNNVLTIEKDLEKNRKVFEKYIKSEPNNTDYYYQFAHMYETAGVIDVAIRYYQKVLKMNASHLSTLNRLAGIAYKEGHYEDAISFYKTILKVDPNLKEIYYNIGCIYSKLAKAPEAMEWLKAALDKGYNNWKRIRTDDDLNKIRKTANYKNLIRTYFASESNA